MVKMVIILTDVMDRFHGVYEFVSDATSQLYIRHGTPEKVDEDVDGTLKITFPDGKVYKVESHTPSAYKYR